MSQTATKATWTDPPGGDNLAVVAGEVGQIYLNFENNVDKSRTFEVRIESDLSSKLVSAEKSQIELIPWGEEVAVINLTPAEIGSAGTYQFTVEIWCDGSLVEPPGRRTYLLVVTPAPAPTVPAEPITPTEATATTEPAVPIKPTEPSVPTEPTHVPVPTAEFEVSNNESDQQPETIQSPVDNAATMAPPEDKSDKGKTKIKQEVRRLPAIDEPAPPPEQKPQTQPEEDELTPFVQSTPTAVSFANEELGGQNFTGISAPREEPASEELKIVSDQEFTNLADGKEIRLGPGEVVSLKFLVEDKHQRNPARPNEAFTYVLHVEHELPSAYVDPFVKPQQDVLPGGTGLLALALKPDASAKKGTYGLNVHIAIAGQTPIAIYRYKVTIQPKPAVFLANGHVTAERAGEEFSENNMTAKCIAFAPFFKRLDYPLTVGPAANSETAYRLSVLDPEKLEDGKTPSPLDGGARYIYENGPWLYLFDRELGELKETVTNRPPELQLHEFRLRRRGIWWAGLWEKHEVTAEAVPVTDPTNDRKLANQVVLKGIRWRILPFPWFISVPLLLLAIWFSGLFNAPTPVVLNAIIPDPKGYVVLGETASDYGVNASATVTFKEESWIYHLERQGVPAVKLSNSEDSLSLGIPDTPYVYTSKSAFATSDPLTVHILSPRPTGLTISDEKGSLWNPTKMPAKEFGHDAYTMTLSSSQTSHVVFRVDPGHTLAFYTIHEPDDLRNPNGNTHSLNGTRAGEQDFVLTPGPHCSGNTWDLVTSDNIYTIIHIHFSPDGANNASLSGVQTGSASTGAQYPSDNNVVPRPTDAQIAKMSSDDAWFALYSILMTYGYDDFSGVPQNVQLQLQNEAKSAGWFTPNPKLTPSMLGSKGLLSDRDFEVAQKLIARAGAGR